MYGLVVILSFSIPVIFLKMMIFCSMLAGLKCMISSDLSAFSLMSILCISTKRIHNELGEGGDSSSLLSCDSIRGWATAPTEFSSAQRWSCKDWDFPFPYCNPAGMPSSSQLTMTSKQHMPALGKWLCQCYRASMLTWLQITITHIKMLTAEHAPAIPALELESAGSEIQGHP